jgi:ATP-dependent Clp protease, protease subunit
MDKMSINIFGVVGEDVRASEVIPKIQAEKGETIEVNIMSVGGSVVEGMAIYDTLRNTGKKIITRALGQACSIASVIFMAGDEREVGDNAEIMIHNALVGVCGNKHELSEFIDRLDGIDQKLINIYASRSSLNENQVRELLDKETFMDADEAVKNGFATSKADALALVAKYNLKQTEKEPVIMATEEETKAGFLSHMMAYFKSDVKAEGEEEKKEEPKAEDEEEKEEEVPAPSEAKAEGDEQKPEEEEAKAEDSEEEEESEEMKALKAELADTKNKLAEAEAKAIDKPKAVKEEAKNVAGLIFDAVTDNKVTMHEAKALCSRSLDDVKAVLSGKEANATGRGQAQTPTSEAVNHKEEFNALAKEDPAKAQAYYKKHVKEIRKES